MTHQEPMSMGKQWIDIITQPGWAFGFGPVAGYSRLVHDKKAAVVYTSGVYSVGAAPALGSDFRSTFFTDWLRFIGIDQVTEIRWQPTALTAST
jgi:FMN-dependent NADH-azoreductase